MKAKMRMSTRVLSMRLWPQFVLVSLLIGPVNAWANPIYFEVDNISGDVWQYTYTVANNTGANINWFSIFFDFDLYEFDLISDPMGDLVDPGIFGGPVGWDLLVLPPDPLFPGPADDQPGLYDGFALGAPIAPGEFVAGFTIQFHWLGTGTPGSQPFTLFGEDLLPVLSDNFFTQPFPVTEPGTLLLLCVGLLFVRRRHKNCAPAQRL